MSMEMFIVNASTVYEKVTEMLQADEIPLTNLISIFSDSAAYMHTFSDNERDSQTVCAQREGYKLRAHECVF